MGDGSLLEHGHLLELLQYFKIKIVDTICRILIHLVLLKQL